MKEQGKKIIETGNTHDTEIDLEQVGDKIVGGNHDNNESFINTAKVVRHPAYNNNTYDNDIFAGVLLEYLQQKRKSVIGGKA